MGVVVHESKRGVALSAKKAADAAGVMAMVYRQGLPAWRIATDGAAAPLLGQEGIVLLLGDPELPEQLLTPVVRPDALRVPGLVGSDVGSPSFKPGFRVRLLDPSVRLSLLAPTTRSAPRA